MEVLLLGGAGSMGSVAARDLLESEEVSKLIIGDSDVKKARTLVNDLGHPNAVAEFCDVTNESQLTDLMTEVDIVANATWFEHNLLVTNAAIKTRKDYVDLGGLYHMTLRQLELDQSAREAGITALLGCGAAPGFTNILAAYGASKLDAVDEIKVSEGRIDKSDNPRPTHSIRSIFEGWTKPAVVYRDFKYEEVPPLTVRETVRYPEPVGELEHYYYIHSELATLPKFIRGVRKVSFVNSHPEMKKLRTLVDLRLISSKDESLDVKGTKITQRDFIISYFSSLPQAEVKSEEYWATKVTVMGKKNEEKVIHEYDSVTPSYIKWDSRVIAYVTGVALSIGTQLLGKHRAKAKGVVPPESAFDPYEFLREMGKRQIRVRETIIRNIV
ncbi:MAG: saccharopine dehydrogenase family protein [Candidatus Bathyarchaeia archaeon]